MTTPVATGLGGVAGERPAGGAPRGQGAAEASGKGLVRTAAPQGWNAAWVYAQSPSADTRNGPMPTRSAPATPRGGHPGPGPARPPSQRRLGHDPGRGAIEL